MLTSNKLVLGEEALDINIGGAHMEFLESLLIASVGATLALQIQIGTSNRQALVKLFDLVPFQTPPFLYQE